MTFEDARAFTLFMREQGAAEFSLGELSVKFREEAAQPADRQHETPTTGVKRAARSVGGLVPREPDST